MNIMLTRIAVVVCLLSTQWVNAQSASNEPTMPSDSLCCKNLAIIAKIHPVIVAVDNQQYGWSAHGGCNKIDFKVEEIKRLCPSLVKSEVKMVPWGKNSVKRTKVESVDMQQLVLLLFGAVQELQRIVKPAYSDFDRIIFR